MITRIKMEVTPDLSRRIQEIVFDIGGRWKSGGKKVVSTDKRYLYLSEFKVLVCGSCIEDYNQDSYKEVSPYDFISTRGEQGLLPDYGEECEFSCDEDFQSVHTEKFRCYMPDGMYSYLSTDGHFYKYCRPIRQTKTIVIDGKKIEVSIEGLEDLKQQLKDN